MMEYFMFYLMAFMAGWGLQDIMKLAQLPLWLKACLFLFFALSFSYYITL